MRMISCWHTNWMAREARCNPIRQSDGAKRANLKTLRRCRKRALPDKALRGRAVVVFWCAAKVTWRCRECRMAGWAVLFQGSLIPIRAWTVALQAGQVVGILPRVWRILRNNGIETPCSDRRWALSNRSVVQPRTRQGEMERWTGSDFQPQQDPNFEVPKPTQYQFWLALALVSSCEFFCLLGSLWDMWPGRSEKFLCSCFLWWLCRMRQTPWVKLLQRLSCWETSQFLQ